MALVDDISTAYRRPRQALAAQLREIGEGRIIIFAFLFGFFTFLSRLPGLSLATRGGAHGYSFTNQALIQFIGSVFWIPLMLYLLAALSHAVLLPFGGRASWQQARLALVWAALVTSPLVLLGGALKVFAPSQVFLIVSITTAMVFLWQWAVCLRLVEFPAQGGKT